MQAVLLAVSSLLAAPGAPATQAVAAAQAVRTEPIVRAITALQDVPGRTRVTGTPGAEAARIWLVDALAARGVSARRAPFEVRHTFAAGRRMPAVNLVARLGPADGEALVLAAHLDTKAAEDPAHAAKEGWAWDRDPAPGADDDGSGAAALLEVARVLAPMQGGLRRPIILAWTDAEELAKVAPDGFMEDYGAEALAEDLAARGQPVAAALAVDMLLKPRGYGYLLRVYHDGAASSARLALVLRSAAGAVAPEVVIEPRLAPGFTYSDHGAFWALGQGGLLLIEDDFHHLRYHRTTDVFEARDGFYDIGQVVAATRALVATALLF